MLNSPCLEDNFKIKKRHLKKNSPGEKHYTIEEISDFQVQLPQDVTVQVISELRFAPNGFDLGGNPKIIPQKISRRSVLAGKSIIFITSDFYNSFRAINAPALIQTSKNVFLGVRVLDFSTEELKEMTLQKK